MTVNMLAMGRIPRVLICALETNDLIQGETAINVTRIWIKSDMLNVAFDVSALKKKTISRTNMAWIISVPKHH